MEGRNAMRPAIPNGNYCFYTRDVVCSGHEPDHFRKDLHPGKTGTLRPGPHGSVHGAPRHFGPPVSPRLPCRIVPISQKRDGLMKD